MKLLGNNKDKRRSRFEGRIDLERQFLTPVNAAFGEKAPLAGMTRDAIESWRLRAIQFASTSKVDAVAALLLEASARGELLADNSRDVFEPEHRHGESLAEVHRLLKEALTDELTTFTEWSSEADDGGYRNL
jgi:hypothetical protein